MSNINILPDEIILNIILQMNNCNDILKLSFYNPKLYNVVKNNVREIISHLMNTNKKEEFIWKKFEPSYDLILEMKQFGELCFRVKLLDLFQNYFTTLVSRDLINKLSVNKLNNIAKLLQNGYTDLFYINRAIQFFNNQNIDLLIYIYNKTKSEQYSLEAVHQLQSPYINYFLYFFENGDSAFTAFNKAKELLHKELSKSTIPDFLK